MESDSTEMCDVCVVWLCMLDMSWLLYNLLWSTTHTSVYSHQPCFWQATYFFFFLAVSLETVPFGRTAVLQDVVFQPILMPALSGLYWTTRKLGKLSDKGSMEDWRMWLILRTTDSDVMSLKACGGLWRNSHYQFRKTQSVPKDMRFKDSVVNAAQEHGRHLDSRHLITIWIFLTFTEWWNRTEAEMIWFSGLNKQALPIIQFVVYFLFIQAIVALKAHANCYAIYLIFLPKCMMSLDKKTSTNKSRRHRSGRRSRGDVYHHRQRRNK